MSRSLRAGSGGSEIANFQSFASELCDLLEVERPKPALPQQKFDLTTYLPEQKTRSYTNVYDSLTHAFGLLESSAPVCVDTGEVSVMP